MTNQQELGTSVSELGELLQDVSGTVPEINDIRAFCYSIQLCYFLSTGMLKSSKQCIRQLHMTVQSTEGQQNSAAGVFRSTIQNIMSEIRIKGYSKSATISLAQLKDAHRFGLCVHGIGQYPI